MRELYIKLCQQLSTAQLIQLCDLVEVCRIHDQYSMKIYWEIVSNRQTPEAHDWIIIDQDKLIAYLGLFIFTEQPATVSLLVHPEYRQQHIAKRLIKVLEQTLFSYGLEECSFLIPDKARQKILAHDTWKAHVQQTNWEYIVTKQPDFITQQPRLTLRTATQEDIDSLAAIHSSVRESNFNELQIYYQSWLKQDNCLSWLAYNEQNQLVGIASVEILADKTRFISNFAIQIELQKQGYGREFFYCLLHKLQPTPEQPIIFETLIKIPEILIFGKLVNIYHHYYYKFDKIMTGCNKLNLKVKCDNTAYYQTNMYSLEKDLRVIRWILAKYISKNHPDKLISEITNLSDEVKTEFNQLDELCKRLNLTSFERQILLLCLGMELYSDFWLLISQANYKTGICFPTLDLAMRIFDGDWRALESLHQWKLIEIKDTGNFATSPLRLTERALNYFLAIPSIATELRHWLCPLTAELLFLPSQHKIAQAIVEQLHNRSVSGALPIIQLIGEDSVQIEQISRLIASFYNKNLWLTTLEGLPHDFSLLDEFCQLLKRELLLSNGILFINGQLLACSTTGTYRKQKLLEFIKQLTDAFPRQIILFAEKPLQTSPFLSQIVHLATLSNIEKASVLDYLLGSLSKLTINELTVVIEQFQLGLYQLTELAQKWRQSVITKNDIDQSDLLWHICREGLEHVIQSNKLQRVKTKAKWQDLILSAKQRYLIEQLIVQVKYRHVVYHNWGFADKSMRGLGIAVLFTGESGTGKTMAAEVIAHELKLDLLQVNLSSILSKYMGETEKNLDEIFTIGEKSGAILLFDEADALFSKRCEIKDSKDRYANQEISYLLQRIEAYQGLCILTTNLKATIDKAFARRFRSIIEFNLPDVDSRTKIWQTVLPANLPHAELNFAELARSPLSGGEIRIAALNAASIAASEASCLSMEHLKHTISEELKKKGLPPECIQLLNKFNNF